VERDNTNDHPVLRIVGENEEIHGRARIGEAEVVVTDQRLLVGNLERLLMDIPIAGLRRIQFDIERKRPATLVIVPEEAEHEPQVLPVPPRYYREVADALVLVGRRLAEVD